MKQISVSAIIEGIRARKDRSLGLSITTPELSTQEKALFMELQGINLNILITPTDEPTPEQYKIDKDLDQKSPSQRMRAVLFILFKQNSEDMDFPTYYQKHMEKLINYLKDKIED